MAEESVNQHPSTLREQPSGNLVAAIIHDSLPLESLVDAEEQWSPERFRVRRRLMAGHPDESTRWPQSLHWDWARKAGTIEPSRITDIGDVRIFGIEALGRWQGLLLALNDGRKSRSAVPEPLVYIDYIEVAPWNWDIHPIGQVGRYRGAGLSLIERAIRWSISLGYEGRVALHSLPQAEFFYRDYCLMYSFGPDPSYHNLCYFELSGFTARSFLRQ